MTDVESNTILEVVKFLNSKVSYGEMGHSKCEKIDSDTLKSVLDIAVGAEVIQWIDYILVLKLEIAMYRIKRKYTTKGTYWIWEVYMENELRG